MEMANKIRIPKQFELGGRTIYVKYEKNLVDKTDFIGTAEYRKNCIVIQKNGDNFNRPVDTVEEVFFHELTHWILEMMEERDLSKSEKFVNTFAILLHQAFKTMEYK